MVYLPKVLPIAVWSGSGFSKSHNRIRWILRWHSCLPWPARYLRSRLGESIVSCLSRNFSRLGRFECRCSVHCRATTRRIRSVRNPAIGLVPNGRVPFGSYSHRWRCSRWSSLCRCFLVYVVSVGRYICRRIRNRLSLLFHSRQRIPWMIFCIRRFPYTIRDRVFRCRVFP